MAYLELIGEEREQEIQSLLGKAGKTPLFQYWQEYMDAFRTLKRSEDTIQNTANALRFFLLHSDLLAIEDWLEPRRAQDEFFRLKRERGWSESTYNSYRKNINSYFLHLVRRGYAWYNPISNVDRASEPVQDQSTISNDDIQKVLRYLDNDFVGINRMQRMRNRLFITLLGLTGARPKELLGLSLSSFSGRRDELVIRTAKSTGRTRVYPLNQRVVDMVVAYIREVTSSGRSQELNTSFFLSTDVGSPWTYTALRKTLEGISKATGVKLTAYMFRRHAATELYARGLDINQIQYTLGHTRLSTTLRYIQPKASMNKASTDMLSEVLIY